MMQCKLHDTSAVLVAAQIRYKLPFEHVTRDRSVGARQVLSSKAGSPELGGRVCEEPAGHVGVGLCQQLIFLIC